MYEKIFGLSCVENHVLAILKQRNEKIEYIYYDSGLSLHDLYVDLVEKGVKQEYFNRIERIQNVLKKMGIIDFVKTETVQFDNVRQAVYRCKENEYILIRVTPYFSKTVLMARGFRPDHFVYIRAGDGNFEVINDIPERAVLFTDYQFKENFAGEFFRLIVKRRINKEDILYLWGIRKFCPEYVSNNKININKLENVEDIGIKLRNLTGVYKILRYRMFYYYGNYINTDFILKTMPQIEKVYTMSEYYNLKPGISIDKYIDLFYRLNEIDDYIMKKLSKEMECIKIDKRKN